MPFEKGCVMPNLSIEEKANSFAYITFKMQANMHGVDQKFYGLENTVKRITSCIFACASGSSELLQSAKTGMIDGFNKLKHEENIPILCYETIDEIIQILDKKLIKKVS